MFVFVVMVPLHRAINRTVHELSFTEQGGGIGFPRLGAQETFRRR